MCGVQIRQLSLTPDDPRKDQPQKRIENFLASLRFMDSRHASAHYHRRRSQQKVPTAGKQHAPLRL